MNSEREIRELFATHNVQLSANDVWMVQSSPVVKHRALERLAAALAIRFDAPQILRAERDEAVILVSAKLGDASEWSIGEALVNANYRVSGRMAPYVYAMAEKRAKDRVIIKLAKLHGVYSEVEADEFVNSDSARPQRPPRPPEPANAPMSQDASQVARDEMLETIEKHTSAVALEAWSISQERRFNAMLMADQEAVRDAYESKMQALTGKAAA